jgi:hypothetical protein
VVSYQKKSITYDDSPSMTAGAQSVIGFAAWAPFAGKRTKDETIRSVARGSSFRNPAIARPPELALNRRKPATNCSGAS